MRKSIFTYCLLSALLLSLASCVKDDDGQCTEKHGLRFYAFNREGVNEFSSVIRNILLSGYQQDTFVAAWKLPAQPYVVPPLPGGNFVLTAFANLSDTLSYDNPLTAVRLKAGSNGYYQPAGDLFFGEKLFISRPDKHPKEPVNDSVFLNRSVGKVRVIINKIPVDTRDYSGEVIVSGTAIGINKFNHPLTESVKVMNKGKIVNNKFMIDVVCFPSIDTLKVETNLRSLLGSNQDYELSRILHERVTPNKLIIVEYEYQSPGTIVELHITVVDWDDQSENSSEEAS